MRLIARLNKPTGGKIIQSLDPKLKQKVKGSKAWFKKVGVVYQNPDYQLFMPTVWQEIEFAATSKEYAERMIVLFNLQHLRDRHPQSLSEGQKRRVSIAAVMAAKPELLLLDEPTVGQDYNGLCDLVDILNTLHRETGNTMITVTHDKRCVSALCDKAIIICGGKVSSLGGKPLAESYFN
jgi:energy-coupling factor transport system ATP-binding protein